MPIYMSLSGIPGESTAAGYLQWIELMSFSWGVSNSPTTGRDFSSMNVMLGANIPAPKLMLATAAGTHIKTGIIAATRTSSDKPFEYLRITLTDVLVSSFQQSHSDGENGPPMESLSLNFTKIVYKAVSQKPDGSSVVQSVFWDLKSNTGG